MRIPFTADEFLDVFARYNLAVWPMQAPLTILALCAIGASVAAPARAHGAVGAILAFLWAWMAGAYHLVYFAPINPAAYGFALAFALQAALFARAAMRGEATALRLGFDARSTVSVGLLLYALVGYPLLGASLGHSYPRAPTFGLPCRTTIFTIAFLISASPRPPSSLVVIPLCWSAIGTVAALRLGMADDLGLTVAGVALVGSMVVGRRCSRLDGARKEEAVPSRSL